MTEDRRSPICRGRISCTCGWEARLGYGVAFTLAVFEAKRLLVLALEIFAEWQVIRLAGGTQPVALTLANVTLGLPCALMTVRTVRRHKLSNFDPSTKQVLKCLLMIIIVCATMNTATLASIGYHISVRQETLANIFNASMQLYVNAASYKYAIDEIQFVLQCCGHSSYTDWFLFDWQRVDYASREEMAEQSRISDEEYRNHAVPFSCCNLRAVAPCMHTEMTNDRTINVNGCAEVISSILLRIVIVAYVMTSTLIVIQVLLAFLITRMLYRFLRRTSHSRIRRSTAWFTIISASPRTYVPLLSSVKSVWRQRPDTHCHPLLANEGKRKVRLPTGRRNCPSISHGSRAWDVAKIKPSVHEEHKIFVKRFHKHIR